MFLPASRRRPSPCHSRPLRTSSPRPGRSHTRHCQCNPSAVDRSNLWQADFASTLDEMNEINQARPQYTNTTHTTRKTTLQKLLVFVCILICMYSYIFVCILIYLYAFLYIILALYADNKWLYVVIHTH